MDRCESTVDIVDIMGIVDTLPCLCLWLNLFCNTPLCDP